MMPAIQSSRLFGNRDQTTSGGTDRLGEDSSIRLYQYPIVFPVLRQQESIAYSLCLLRKMCT